MIGSVGKVKRMPWFNSVCCVVLLKNFMAQRSIFEFLPWYKTQHFPELGKSGAPEIVERILPDLVQKTGFYEPVFRDGRRTERRWR